MAKDRITGKAIPWDPIASEGWVDGSVDNDLPMNRLAEMFCVNHFIVSQVNPHVVPFLAKEEEALSAAVQQDVPVSTGSITLGENGIPTAWNFSLQLTKSMPGVRDLEFDEDGELIYFNDYSLPSKTSWLFESSYGAGTCNCDRYRYDDDIYIERAYYSWAYANTLGFLYDGESSPSNRSVTKVDVPEPKTYLLLALGLIVLCVRKMRRNNFI